MSEDVRQLKDRAQELMLKGRVDLALATYQSVIALAPEDAGARQKLGDLLHKSGKPKEAVAEYEQAARAYAASGELLKAVAVCKVILQADASHTRTQQMLADLYAKRRGDIPVVTVPVAPAATIRPVAAVTSAAPVQVLGRIALRSVKVPAYLGNIPAIPLFSELGRSAFLAVAAHAQLRTFAADEPVVREGDAGTSMFAIVQGTVKVVRTPKDGPATVMNTLMDGAFFGEMALMTGAPRMATVVSMGVSQLLEFSKTEMDVVMRQHPSVTRVLERFFRERLLSNLMRSSELFQALGPAEQEHICAAFKTRVVPPGTVLLTQGQMGDAFYLVLRGRCAVSHRAAGGALHQVKVLQEGDVFGEMALLFQAPVSATVSAVTPCVLLRLTRQSFEEHVMSHGEVGARVKLLGQERRRQLDELAQPHRI